MITITQTRDIAEYGKLVKPLLPDFGPIFCVTVMEWCRVVPDDYTNFWEWYIIKDDGVTIGCCGLYSLDEHTDELWLSWFGILPEHRSKGVGLAALNFLVGLAGTLGCKVIRSYVDKEGKPLEFYRRNGFSVVSTVREFLEANSLRKIDGDNFEDPDDYVIERFL